MILLGSKSPARNVEQHDYFFGIARSIAELVPPIKAFWPESGASLHIDGWREVTAVNGHAIAVTRRDALAAPSAKKLFFINLGGYLPGRLAEQHHTFLAVHEDKAEAIRYAKKEIFFRTNTLAGARSHIDEKYALDVDDIFGVEDILSPEQKRQFSISITPSQNLKEDEIKLGYFRLDKLHRYLSGHISSTAR